MNNALPSAPHLLFLCCSALAPLSFLLLFPFIHILLTLFLAPLFLSLFTAYFPCSTVFNLPLFLPPLLLTAPFHVPLSLLFLLPSFHYFALLFLPPLCPSFTSSPSKTSQNLPPSRHFIQGHRSHSSSHYVAWGVWRNGSDIWPCSDVRSVSRFEPLQDHFPLSAH